MKRKFDLPSRVLLAQYKSLIPISVELFTHSFYFHFICNACYRRHLTKNRKKFRSVWMTALWECLPRIWYVHRKMFRKTKEKKSKLSQSILPPTFPVIVCLYQGYQVTIIFIKSDGQSHKHSRRPLIFFRGSRNWNWRLLGFICFINVLAFEFLAQELFVLIAFFYNFILVDNNE